ncbi:hypothetical protein OROGR_000255 [Orobanche gracilis]
MTRSGRIYAPLEKANEALGNDKGKQKVGETVTSKQMDEGQNDPVHNEEAVEFLKLVKQSESAVVDQLNRIPAKISLLSLLMNSDPHRNAPMKVLSDAHVTKDISVDRFEGIVGNISANNFLIFSDAEIPREGVMHNKALYISIKFASRPMRPSSMMVRAFDGTRREVLGEIDLPVKVGPVTFLITFQVMDMVPGYSCLLGRPWIHPANSLPSTLHQKVKFIVDDKLVIVSAEEDMLISMPTSTPYIEVDAEALETPFQSLEIVNATHVKERIPIPKVDLFGMSTVAEKLMREQGYQYGQGLGKAGQGSARLIEFPINKDRSGIGYAPTLADKKRFTAEKKEEEVVGREWSS